MRPAASGARRAGSRRAGKPDIAADQNVQNFQSTASVAGSVAALTFGLVYPWGVATHLDGGSWGSNGGALEPNNKLFAYPHLFPVGVTIKEILMNNQVGAPALVPGTKFKLGIYSNTSPTVPYPAALLAQWAEQLPLQNSIATTTWTNLNLTVSPGTLLWIVQTCDVTTGINLASIGGVSKVQMLLGMQDTMIANPIVGWQITRAYDGTLPNPFPTTPPTPLLTNHTSPAFMMRFR
jgi:hypothetical protein